MGARSLLGAEVVACWVQEHSAQGMEMVVRSARGCSQSQGHHAEARKQEEGGRRRLVCPAGWMSWV
jgi:hypothetical protein